MKTLNSRSTGIPVVAIEALAGETPVPGNRLWQRWGLPLVKASHRAKVGTQPETKESIQNIKEYIDIFNTHISLFLPS